MKNIFQILKIIALISILYGLIVLSLIGPNRLFNFYYLILGIALFCCASYFSKSDENTKRTVLIILGVLALCFVLAEIRIVSFSLSRCKDDADYVIVLGSQIRDNGPSMDYKARLDSAYEYLEANRNSRVICTGGKGSNEPISEAQGGAEYLLNRGIDKGKIILEDQSTNTVQNLRNAKALIEKEKPIDKTDVVIVSTDYHLCRAAYIARKLGYKNVSVKGARGLAILLPHYYTREFYAFFKELIAL